MRAIETTGRIEKTGLLKLDMPIAINKKQRVKVIILYTENKKDEMEIDEQLWLSTISNNQVFDFLKDSKEDIYSLADGKKINK